MQWVSKQLAAAASGANLTASANAKPPPPTASSAVPFTKLARISGPLNCDTFAFVLSKMKQDGFTGVLVSVTPEDWRLQHPLIVSCCQFPPQLLTLALHALTYSNLRRFAVSSLPTPTSTCNKLPLFKALCLTRRPPCSSSSSLLRGPASRWNNRCAAAFVSSASIAVIFIVTKFHSFAQHGSSAATHSPHTLIRPHAASSSHLFIRRLAGCSACASAC